jgi:hypothetical protein
MAEALVSRDHNLSRATPILPGTSSPAGRELPLVRIYQPGRSVTSSGPPRKGWVLEFERSSAPYIEPLMGWTGGDDPFAQIRLTFPDLQSAIGFSERHGWRYRVEEPPPRRVPLKSYAEQFRYNLADAIQRVAPYAGPMVSQAARTVINQMAGHEQRGDIEDRQQSPADGVADERDRGVVDTVEEVSLEEFPPRIHPDGQEPPSGRADHPAPAPFGGRDG